jgi:mono/diheme cytochrome c family protein
MLKQIILVPVAALVAIALLPVAAGSSQTSPAPPSKLKVTAESQAKAKKLYDMDCALCHGATGDGKTDVAKDMELTMTDWTDPKALADHPDQELFNVIRNGKGKMPPEDPNRAKDEEIWNLIVYIRAFGKAQPAASPAPGPATAPAPGK